MSLIFKGFATLPQGQIKIRDLISQPASSLLWTLNNPTPEINDQFGHSVSISGNYAIVSAWRDNTGATDAGSAYIYDVTTGSLLWTLNNPTPADTDFGRSVSISGNYAIVGASHADTGATDAGSAYIYDVTTGTLLRTLNNPTPAINEYFGFSVSISGNYAIVGAQNDDPASIIDAGSAYIYDVTTGVLLRTLNNPTPAATDGFGSSVSISGNYAIVGAQRDNTGEFNAGSAYIYDVTTGSLLWTLNNPTPADSDYFGNSVSISGNYAIVGAYWDDTGADSAGSAYIYDVTTGALVHTLNNPTPAINEYFGYSVSISGNYAIVSGHLEDTGAPSAGSAYIYDVTTGALLQTLNNPSPAQFENFGWSVAIDGNRAIVGARQDDTGADNAGSAYIYTI